MMDTPSQGSSMSMNITIPLVKKQLITDIYIRIDRKLDPAGPPA